MLDTFFGVLCDFVVLGGLGGYPLQQCFGDPQISIEIELVINMEPK